MFICGGVDLCGALCISALPLECNSTISSTAQMATQLAKYTAGGMVVKESIDSLLLISPTLQGGLDR